MYAVLVGNIGWVLQDVTDESIARETYERYIHMSECNTESRAYGESVSLWYDDEPLEVHEGFLDKEEYT